MAEPPSFSTSIRSIALMGMLFTSTAAPAPLPSCSAFTGSRRPFSRISKLRSDRPRICRLVVPEPEGELPVSSPWSSMSSEAMFLTSSLIEVAPLRSMSLRL